ncbi:hypothetical protein D3C87_1329470 [compost metagenome]
MRRHRAVGDHQVQALDRQVGQQTFKLVFATGDAQRFAQLHGRCDQAIDDGLGHHVGHTNAKQDLLFIGLCPQHQFQFATELEHLFGIGQGLAAGLGQFELPSDSPKQLDAKGLFQQ